MLFALAISLNARDFNVQDFGAHGDGIQNDTAAIQHAINAATAVHGRVVVPRGHRYLVATLELKGGIDFHLAGNLVISTNQQDYTGEGVITASNAMGLKITGNGNIEGRSLSFMTGYDKPGEWWLFKEWRPKMFILTGCTNLLVRDITFSDAPYWGLHMLGCENVTVQNVTVSNRLDVPNCDGIDPDHCRNVKISGCHLVCGDDAIVVKSTRQTNDFGPCADISVRDCTIETQDSGLKIGTETVGEIRNVRFEHCKILRASRGLTIQLRDEGEIHDILFRDIQFVSQYHSDPWWGRGEAISLTAIPRFTDTKLGIMHHIRIENVQGRAENSIRIAGSTGSRVHDVVLDRVHLTLDRWTSYPGGVFDNRPTKVIEPIQTHGTPGIMLSHADGITVKDCTIQWGSKLPDYFTAALETEDVSGLHLENFKGKAAHPEKSATIHRN